MATNNLQGLYTASGTKITADSTNAKQRRKDSGIPVLMADSIAVTYTTSSGTNAMGDPITVANFTTLDEKLSAMDASIAA